MNSKSTLMNSRRHVLAVFCAVAIGQGDAFAYALSPRPAMPQASPSQETASAIPPDQLDSLVAPIALYPDPLLAQTLAASTYPLELMQLQQWLARNPGLKDKALADAVAQQPWDPSIAAMAALPDVVKRLTDDIQWATDLGNAFLAQQADVMDAVQRMRHKAQDKGTLKSGQQQVVETQVIENERVIVIEQASPEVVYVPSYDPVVVYGAPAYPYPPIYYPPAGYYAAGMAISFGAGVAMGAFWGSGGWGWGPRWGNNDITINNNNNFVRNANVRSGYRSGTVNNTWQHRPEHRGGTPYRDRTTANKFGGTTRGDSLNNRQASARQQINRQGGNLPSGGAVGTSGRTGDLQNRVGGSAGNRAGGAGLDSRAGTSSIGTRAGGTAPSSRDIGGGASRSGGGTDRIGQRDLSRSGGGGQSAFGGGSQQYNGASARTDSSRGSSSMRSSSSSSGMRSHGGGASRRSGGGGGRRR
jgi:uncharacterized protein DUF3300